jgi:hypothetical protein
LRQFVGNRHAIGKVRRLGFGQQIGDFGFQLLLDLTRMLIGQRACRLALAWIPAGTSVRYSYRMIDDGDSATVGG